MQKKTNSPRARLMRRKLLDGFNPFKPTDLLKVEVNDIVLPQSKYLGTAMRGKALKELTLEQLEYYAFDLKQGDEKAKLIAKLYYFVRLTKVMEEERLTREDIMEMVNDTFKVDLEDNVDDDLDF